MELQEYARKIGTFLEKSKKTQQDMRPAAFEGKKLF